MCELMNVFSQREVQKIEAAAQRKKKMKSAMHDKKSDEEFTNEYESDNYENTKFFLKFSLNIA